jgi:hypothetical protein
MLTGLHIWVCQAYYVRREYPGLSLDEGVHVPEEYRRLYEQLNLRLALNVIISDTPSAALSDRFTRYIANHRYRPRECISHR